MWKSKIEKPQKKHKSKNKWLWKFDRNQILELTTLRWEVCRRLPTTAHFEATMSTAVLSGKVGQEEQWQILGLFFFPYPVARWMRCKTLLNAKVVMILRHLIHFDLIHLIPSITLDSRYRTACFASLTHHLHTFLTLDMNQVDTCLPCSSGRCGERVGFSDSQWYATPCHARLAEARSRPVCNSWTIGWEGPCRGRSLQGH